MHLPSDATFQACMAHFFKKKKGMHLSWNPAPQLLPYPSDIIAKWLGARLAMLLLPNGWVLASQC
jgi:hypothetical protein